MNSRQKGVRGEREWRNQLRKFGFDAERGQQFRGGSDSPDVVCPALAWLHPEVKRTERLSLYDAIDQAARDADPDQLPYVAHRRNHHDWLVIMRAKDWIKLVREHRV